MIERNQVAVIGVVRIVINSNELLIHSIITTPHGVIIIEGDQAMYGI